MFNYQGKLAIRKAQGYHIEEITHPDYGLFGVVFVSMSQLEVHPIKAKLRGKTIGGQSDFKFVDQSYWTQEYMGMHLNGDKPDPSSKSFSTLYEIGNSMKLAAVCSASADKAAKKALKLVRVNELREKVGELQRTIADLQYEINQLIKEIA